jgi:radical SAM superfamily enzyme YgiQ (UPF0313 family)
MAYATSYLISNGYEATLIDAVAQEEYSYGSFIKNLKQQKPDIVVMEVSTPSFDIDLWLAEQISTFAEVALAGPHLTITAEKVLKKNPFISYILKGEYIQSALEMAETRKKGIYETDVVTDFDSLPYPYRDYPEATQYFDFTMDTPKPQLQMYATKGCPFRCSFCIWPQKMYLRKVAFRSPENVAKEIRLAVKKYGYKSILFDDDTYNLGGPDRLNKLSALLKKIGLPWTIMGRLDASSLSVFDTMVKSGCVGMRFGVETFNADVLRGVNKGLERSNFRETLEYLAKTYPKLMLRVFMMRDLPGQTEKMHQNDLRILKEMGFAVEGNKYRQIQISRCAPFPGTEMYDQIKKTTKKVVLNNTKLYDGSQATVMSK